MVYTKSLYIIDMMIIIIPILETPAVMMTDVIEVHPENAAAFMYATLLLIVKAPVQQHKEAPAE